MTSIKTDRAQCGQSHGSCLGCFPEGLIRLSILAILSMPYHQYAAPASQVAERFKVFVVFS